MQKDVLLYGVIMVGGLAAAYWASLPEEEGASKVALFNISPEQIAAVSFEDDAKKVRVTADRRDVDGRFWVQHSKEKAPPPPAEGTENSAPAADPEVTIEKFLSNDRFGDIVASFSPLNAEREIGAITEEQKEEFGLADAKQRFVVQGKGERRLELTVGKESYGSNNYFVLNSSDSKVYLVEGAMFEDLGRANLRLYERRVTFVDQSELTGVKIVSGEASKEITGKVNAKGEMEWFDQGAEAPKPSYQSWMNKVFRLRLVKFADDQSAAMVANQQPFLSVQLMKGAETLDTLNFFRQDGADGERPKYWVHSTGLNSHAEVSANRLDPLEKDIPTIVGS